MAKQAESEREAWRRQGGSTPRASFRPRKTRAGRGDDVRPAHCPATALPPNEREISSEHNTTTFLPIPMDLVRAFVKKAAEEAAKPESASGSLSRVLKRRRAPGFVSTIAGTTAARIPTSGA